MTQWHYADGGNQLGPVSDEELKNLLQNGSISSQTLVWSEGMAEWAPVGSLPGIDAGAINPYASPTAGSSLAVTPTAPGEDIEPGSDPFDASACIGRGWRLVIDNFGIVFIIGLVYFGISILFGIVEGVLQDGGTPTAASGVVNIVGQVVSIFLSLGAIHAMLKLVDGEHPEVGDLFSQGPQFLRGLGAYILYCLMVLVGCVLLIVPGIYLACRFGFFMQGIVDKNLGVMDSFNYSSELTTNNRLNVFLLYLLSFGVAILGLLALGVGLIVALPVTYVAHTVAFRWMQRGRQVACGTPV